MPFWSKAEAHRDPQLGELRRSGRHWKGTIVAMPGATFRLALSGNRGAPDVVALQLARDLPARMPALVPDVQRGLFDHYLPYKEAGVQTDGSFPQISRPEDTWSHVKPAHVLIEPLRDTWTVEVAFTTAWDVEHIVAAIVQDWRVVALNGSVRRQ